MNYIVFTDGACFGNPGPMGLGASLVCDGEEVDSVSLPAGKGTNNEAELRAVLLGVTRALEAGATTITIRSDSEWTVKILKKVYRLKAEHLKGVVAEIMALTEKANVEFTWIPREQNQRADDLSKAALGR